MKVSMGFGPVHDYWTALYDTSVLGGRLGGQDYWTGHEGVCEDFYGFLWGASPTTLYGHASYPHMVI